MASATAYSLRPEGTTAAFAPGRGIGTLPSELLELAYFRPAWMADALCRKRPEVDFHPEPGESMAEARAVCAQCLVRSDCLAWALDHGQGPGQSGGHGVWGGTSASQRSRGEASEIIRRYAAVVPVETGHNGRHLLDRRKAIEQAWSSDPRRSASEVVRRVGFAANGATVKVVLAVKREMEAGGRLPSLATENDVDHGLDLGQGVDR